MSLVQRLSYSELMWAVDLPASSWASLMAALAELSRLWHRRVAAVGTASSSGGGPRGPPARCLAGCLGSSRGVGERRLRGALPVPASAPQSSLRLHVGGDRERLHTVAVGLQASCCLPWLCVTPAGCSSCEDAANSSASKEDPADKAARPAALASDAIAGIT